MENNTLLKQGRQGKSQQKITRKSLLKSAPRHTYSVLQHHLPNNQHSPAKPNTRSKENPHYEKTNCVFSQLHTSPSGNEEPPEASLPRGE
jgi:hypothetical protein